MSALAAFRRRSAAALLDATKRGNLRRATATTLAKRAAGVAALPDYEAQRARLAAARREGLALSSKLREAASERLREAGVVVHFAADGEAARNLVTEIAAAAGATRVVKAKSMITEEIALRQHLEAEGMEVLETDLGEFIVQLANEAPSHIVAPALHMNRRQIGELFVEHLDSPETTDPAALTAIARAHLRGKFLAADIGISGANFVVAETGTLVLLENEGNIGLCTTLPRVHVAIAGIEKILPRLADLDSLLRLLPLNTTGQRAGTYTSLLNGPAPGGAGPEEMHLIWLDGGRAACAESPGAEILACLRCGACLNVCPVFRHVGGHAYAATYPGPMGILISPHLGGDSSGAGLAEACSLCGACGEICPAAIPLPELIHGERSAQALRGPFRARLLWRCAGAVLASPRALRACGTLARAGLRYLPRPYLNALSARWSGGRALPEAPPRSFLHELESRHPGRIA